MKNIIAIFQKQIKDTLKNKSVLIEFLIFPIMSIIMEYSIHIEGMPEHFFANMFAAMYVGMAPLVAMSAIISEKKEKNTLRVLLMSNVKPAEYLIGVGCYIWIICMMGSCAIGISGGYKGKMLLSFLTIIGVGVLVSMLIGAAIGTSSKNQMAATSLTVPVMVVFAFLPMLSTFNESIEKVAKIAYSQQVSILINGIGKTGASAENAVIISGNFLIAVVLFGYAYKKSGMA